MSKQKITSSSNSNKKSTNSTVKKKKKNTVKNKHSKVTTIVAKKQKKKKKGDEKNVDLTNMKKLMDNDSSSSSSSSSMERMKKPNGSFVVESFSNKNNTTITSKLLSSSSKKKDESNSLSKQQKKKNELTELIPGYTAPLELKASSTSSSSLPSISELRRRAQRTDVSTRAFCRIGGKEEISASNMIGGGFLPKQQQQQSSPSTSYSMFKPTTTTKKLSSEDDDKTFGKGWFSMVSHEITEDIQADMAIIRQRTYLDPRRFYKSSDAFGKHIQVGTVIDSASSSNITGRLSNKQRQSNLLDEIRLNDDRIVSYTKNKFNSLLQSRRDATAHFHSKRRKSRTKRRRKGY